jgi:hypothetical protein
VCTQHFLSIPFVLHFQILVQSKNLCTAGVTNHSPLRTNPAIGLHPNIFYLFIQFYHYCIIYAYLFFFSKKKKDFHAKLYMHFLCHRASYLLSLFHFELVTLTTG